MRRLRRNNRQPSMNMIWHNTDGHAAQAGDLSGRYIDRWRFTALNDLNRAFDIGS